MPGGLAPARTLGSTLGPGIDPRLADEPAALDPRPRGESPTDVQAVATGPFAVEVSWIPTTCATGYEIERSDGGARAFTVWRSNSITPPATCTGSQAPADRPVVTGKTVTGTLRGAESSAATTTRMSFVDGSVRYRSAYRYRVGAVYAANATGFAAGVDVTTPQANPATITATADGRGGVAVEWSAAPDAVSYTLAGDGLTAPRTDAGTRYTIARVQGGHRSWTVVANYDTPDGRIADTEAPARATLVVIPPRGLPFLSKPAGQGDAGRAAAHVASLCDPGPCLDLSDVRTYASWWQGCELPPDDYEARSDPLGGPWCTIQEDEAVYGNVTDLGFGRRTNCEAPGNTVVCYARSHGPDPARAGFADAATIVAAAANAAPEALESVNVIIKDPSGVRFGSYVTQPGAPPPVHWGQGTVRSPVARLDTEGAKFTPFSCMACHGGRFNPQTNRVEGATLLPLDPSVLVLPDDASARTHAEVRILQINKVIQGSNPPPAVAEYLAGMAKHPLSEENYVPQGWAQHAPLYQAVIRPYCITCHMAARQDVNLMSYDNMIRNAALIYNDVCRDHTMPHAELTYQRFWSDPAQPSLADQLAQAVGQPRCE